MTIATLQVLLITLKFAEVINWPWWVVLTPIWLKFLQFTIVRILEKYVKNYERGVIK